MRIERVQARQGHPVPRQAGFARGPFPPELFEQPEIVYDRQPRPDDREDEYNVSENFTTPTDSQEWKWFRCEDCRWVLREDELDAHMCDPDYEFDDDDYIDDDYIDDDDYDYDYDDDYIDDDEDEE